MNALPAFLSRSLYPLLSGGSLVLILMTGCAAPLREQPEATPTPDTASATPDLTYEDITLTESLPDGSKLWQLTASTATYEQNQTSASLTNVKGEFYDEQDRSIRVEAEKGSIFPQDQRLELEGEVQVVASHYQLQLQTDRIEWLPQLNQMTAIGQVQITQIDTAELQSQPPTESQLPTESQPPTSSQLDTSPAQTQAPSTSEAPVNSEDPANPPADPQPLTLMGLQINSDRAMLDFTTNQLELSNNDPTQPIEASAVEPPLQVKALSLIWKIEAEQVIGQDQVEVFHQREQIRLTGDQLTAQLTEDRLTLSGNAYARAEETDLELWSDQMGWTIGSPTIEAAGNVRYQQPNQSLIVTGSTATLDWQSSQVAVSGGDTVTQFTLP